jgi:acyl-homoserine-lactone acylase
VLSGRAADVLELWDRRMDATSRGAVLFAEFLDAFGRQQTPFDQGWRADAPLTTPDGLADPAASAALLEAAASRVLDRYGALDIAWGDVFRLRRDSVDLPASGGPGALGIFRVFGFQQSTDGRQTARSGDSWVAAVEFGDSVRARVLLSYGNASQPGSPHRDDQLRLLAGQQLRPVWRTRGQIEAHLELRERF